MVNILHVQELTVQELTFQELTVQDLAVQDRTVQEPSGSPPSVARLWRSAMRATQSVWNSLSHIEEATLHPSVYKRLRTRVVVCLRLQ